MTAPRELVVGDRDEHAAAAVAQPIVRSDVLLNGMPLIATACALQAVYGGPGPLGKRQDWR